MGEQTENNIVLNNEYELLTRHYMHEGDLMLKRNQFFIALNFGLFTLIGVLYKENANNQFLAFAPYFYPILCTLGFVMSVFWAIMTKRASWYIIARVSRLKDLEGDLNYQIMTRIQSQKGVLSDWFSTWKLFIYMGIILAGFWVALFIFFIRSA